MKDLKDFEQSLTKLEQIVEQLEKGDLSLEQSLDYFQKGIQLSQVCTKMLDAAEQKVSILVKEKDGQVTDQPFDMRDNEE